MRRLVLLGALAASGCVQSITVELPGVEAGDLVIVAPARNESRPEPVGGAAFVYRGPTDHAALALPSDAPFFTFRIPAGTLVSPDGQPLTQEVLDQVLVRGSGDDVSIDSNRPENSRGACGRCLIPATVAPQIVNSGDACALPVFAEPRLYRRDGKAFNEDTSEGARAAMASARTVLRLDWPGACACASAGASPRLSELDIERVSPVGAEYRFDVFAQRPGSPVLVAFGEAVAGAFDTAAQRSHISELETLDRWVHSAAAADAPDRFLAITERFGSGSSEGTHLDTFQLQPDLSITGPTNTFMLQETINVMRRSPVPGLELPLVLGGFRHSGTGNDPAITECAGDGSRCNSASIASCPHSVGYSIDELALTPNGSGLAKSYEAVFARETGGAWGCKQLDDPFPWADGVMPGAQPVRLHDLQALGSAGNQGYLCAHRAAERCMPSSAVVLTATLSAGLEPDWRVIYVAPDYTYCREMIAIPGRSDRVQAFLTGNRYLELDDRGHVLSSDQQISARLPAGAPGYETWRSTESGSTVMRATEHALFYSDGPTPMTQLYAPHRQVAATYDATLAVEGAFFIFDDPQAGILELSLEGGEAAFPWGEGRKGGESFRAAVLDTKASTPDRLVVLLAGYEGSVRTPLLRRLFITRDPGGLRTVSAVDQASFAPLPDTVVDGSALVALTEAGPGLFVALDDRTRIWTGDGESMKEVRFDFDDPTTMERELPPTNGAPDCGGEPPALDEWRALDGRNGVAWAVGQRGLIVRIVGEHAERFTPRTLDASGELTPTKESTLTSVKVTCPDQVLFGGVLTAQEFGPTARIWQLSAEGSENLCPSSVPRDRSPGDGRLLVNEVSSACANYPSSIGEYAYAASKRFLVDGESFATVFDNGNIYQFEQPTPMGGRTPKHLKVPFGIRGVAVEPGGRVLFTGERASAAVGSP